MARVLKKKTLNEPAISRDRVPRFCNQRIVVCPKQPIIISPPVICDDNTHTLVVLKEVLKALSQRLVGEMIEFSLVAYGSILKGGTDVCHAGDNGERALGDNIRELKTQSLPLLCAFPSIGFSAEEL